MTPLKIERIVAGGWGLTHMGTKVTFVRGVLPDEIVTITPPTPPDSRREYQFATVDEVQEVSPDRIRPPCQVYAQCGGCQFQHIRYEAQLHYKQLMLEEAFSRIGQVTIQDFLPPVPSPFPFEYRRWIRFSVFQESKKFRLGFLQERSHTHVASSGCLLVPEPIHLVVEEVASRLESVSRLPAFLSSVEVRGSAAFGSHMLILKSPQLHQGQAEALLERFQEIPTVSGCVVMGESPASRKKPYPVRLVQGDDHIFEQFQSKTFRVSDRSFMQSNWTVYEMIGHTLGEWVGACQGLRLLELYAGIGCLGLTLAGRGALVTLVEENPSAAADSRKSAALNHIGRCRFRAGTAEHFLLHVRPNEYDGVIVDPPRSGLSKTCVESLLSAKAPRLFYLSCDPASLARDAANLSAGGYKILRAQLFDMFPQTAHIETLVEFALKKDSIAYD